MNQGYWIKGKFDGDVKSPTPAHGTALTRRISGAEIIRGRLTDISRIKELPKDIELNREIYQRTVSTVHLQPSAGGSGWISPVYDLHLRCTKFITTGWDDSEKNTSLGRVIGIAYARVLPARLEEEPEPFQKIQSERESLEKNSTQSGQSFANVDGGFQFDAGSHGQLNQQTSGATENINRSNDIDLNHESPPPKSESYEKPCEVCKLTWPLGVLLITWLVCDFRWAIVVAMPFLLRCFLSHIPKIPTRSAFKNRIYSFIVLILLLFGAVWSIVNISKDCSNENYFALALIFAGLIFSSRLVHCWIPVLAAILWTLAGLASCSHGLGLCKGISVESVTNDAKTKLQNLKDKVDTTFNRDDDAEAVSNSGQNLDGWKYVSLDGAIKNPDNVFTCPQKITAGKVNYAIYMGNHSLFETAKYTLSDEAMPEMRQLGELLKKYSDVKILIVGHSDNSPHRDGPVGNLLLSERRANTVADWLVENGYISVDRITPIGVGERYPVFNVTNDQQAIASRANRRVDIRVQCNMQVKNDK